VILDVSLSLYSNISSLKSQRFLQKASGEANSAMERLSSGKRINRASDDAAGLAIASLLNADARVFTQGIRNLNDGLSLLNIAEGAIGELSAIATRQKELAEQAANGVYTFKQRQSLDAEANALVDEYNRIVMATEFNGRKLLDGSLSSIRIQAEYGLEGSINVGLGSELARRVGDGTFGAKNSLVTGGMISAIAIDFNGDGKMDVATAPADGSTALSIFLGNGDGTFKAAVTYTTGTAITIGYYGNIISDDYNKDGQADLAVMDDGDMTVSVFLGNGDGSFKTRNIINVGAASAHITSGDFNGDGKSDMAMAAGYVALGNGDGTFKASLASGVSSYGLDHGDFNSDGLQDLAAGNYTFTSLGNGTFTPTLHPNPNNPLDVVVGDINHDGLLDIVAQDYNGVGATSVSVLLGNGNGTFKARTSYALNSAAFVVTLGDMNGDGLTYIITGSEYGGSNVLFGIGNGTFKAAINSPTTAGFWDIDTADFNGDGISDILGSTRSTASADIHYGNATSVTTIAQLNLFTQQDARSALTTINATLARTGRELGLIGAMQSRIHAAINTSQVRTENYKVSESRIVDADIAQDAAILATKDILKQSAAAVLAQANQIPALALTLLK